MISNYSRLEETREELEEFQISSRELEAELEAQLEQLEKKNNVLSQDNSKLKYEVDSLKVSMAHLHEEFKNSSSIVYIYIDNRGIQINNFLISPQNIWCG